MLKEGNALEIKGKHEYIIGKAMEFVGQCLIDQPRNKKLFFMLISGFGCVEG